MEYPSKLMFASLQLTTSAVFIAFCDLACREKRRQGTEPRLHPAVSPLEQELRMPLSMDLNLPVSMRASKTSCLQPDRMRRTAERPIQTAHRKSV